MLMGGEPFENATMDNMKYFFKIEAKLKIGQHNLFYRLF